MFTSSSNFERLTIEKCDAFPIAPCTLCTIQVDESDTHRVTANRLTGPDSLVLLNIFTLRIQITIKFLLMGAKVFLVVLIVYSYPRP